MSQIVKTEIAPNVWELKDLGTGEIVGYDQIGSRPPLDPIRESALNKLKKLGLSEDEAMALIGNPA